jgi:hypothetical protein
VTTTVPRSPGPTSNAAPPSPAGSAVRVHYQRVPDPTADGELTVFAPLELEAALEAASQGATVSRVVGGLNGGAEDESLRAVERTYRRRLTGAARRDWGKVLLWALLGPTLSLVWVNLAPLVALLFLWMPPLAELVATLGAASGGWQLAFVVGLVPTIWGWSRAWRAQSWRARFRSRQRARA